MAKLMKKGSEPAVAGGPEIDRVGYAARLTVNLGNYESATFEVKAEGPVITGTAGDSINKVANFVENELQKRVDAFLSENQINKEG